jgi:DNA-binding YbaB/EbfC family protein
VTDHDDDAIEPDEVTGPGETYEGGLALPGGELPESGGLDLGALLGAGGLDLGSLMEQASQMQEQMAAAQAEAEAQAAATIVTGVAGGRAVEVTVTAGLDFQSVRIDPAAVDPDDVDMLQALVLAALHDAMAQVKEIQAELLTGPDLPDLGGLLG